MTGQGWDTSGWELDDTTGWGLSQPDPAGTAPSVEPVSGTVDVPAGTGWGLDETGWGFGDDTTGDEVVSPAGNLDTIAEARDRLAVARRARAEAIARVTTGQATVEDIIREAATPEGAPLLRVRLDHLIASQPGVGVKEARRQVGHIRDLVPDNGRPATLAWLLDRRVENRRFLAWFDAVISKGSPWRGYPYSPQPSETLRSLSQTAKVAEESM